MVFGKVLIYKNIKVNGWIASQMGKVNRHGKIKIFTKDNLKMDWNMDMELIFIIMVIILKVNLDLENLMD